MSKKKPKPALSQKKFNFDSSQVKKYFITGVVILLPLALTLIIVSFIFNLLTQPFAGAVSSLMQQLNLFPNGFLFLKQEEVISYTSKLFILLFIIGFTVLLGALARWFFINTLISIGEAIVKKIPFINSVYKTSQDVINTIFTSDTKSFKQVVLAPYPNAQTYSIGLITSDSLKGLDKAGFDDPVAVFVPTTPNPTSGFLMMFKRKDLVYIDMSIEAALKYVISCGVLATPIVPVDPSKKAPTKE